MAEEIDVLDRFTSYIDATIDKKIQMYLQTNDCLVKKLARVVTVSGDNTTATVSFPPSTVASTVAYKNRTGAALIADDYVYLFVSFSNPDQGWIMVKK